MDRQMKRRLWVLDIDRAPARALFATVRRILQVCPFAVTRRERVLAQAVQAGQFSASLFQLVLQEL
jgi:hypothetical protein